ncbi:MAG: hypothetical protein J2P18_01015 [Nocardia sp.]|nr:hypothetical protein [Nocardia sp.]
MNGPRTSLPDLTALGLRWDDSGRAALTGALLRLSQDLDRALCLLAEIWHAEPEQHPATIAADQLEHLGYLNSFPHQATFAVALDDSPENLDGFRAEPVETDGAIRACGWAPVRSVLTPAACYHLYIGHRGEQLTEPAYLTTRNTCFRRERHYEPLRRQWSFDMREIVCVAGESETEGFAEQGRAVVSDFADGLGLELTWEPATDPFFRPGTDPRYLLQRIHPVKFEAVCDGLAVGSVNRHFEHFGELMDIDYAGAPAHSTCVAFGLERWLSVIVQTHGPKVRNWPDPVAAADRAAARANVVAR